MMHLLAHRSVGLSYRGPTLVVLALLVTACGGEPGNQGGRPPSPVTVAEVRTESTQHRVEYPGRVRGATEVAVRARVSGILEARLYEEGTEVEAGRPLFRIEPDPYEDAVKSAKAQRAEARAQLLRAEREWERISGLFARDAVSVRERDQARADFHAARARLETAESSLRNAERQLRYTRVEAPVSGITSIESVTEGNLVEAGTLLTYVIQHDPVHVYFALPEDDATAQRPAREAQEADGDNTERQARLIRGDGGEYPHAGYVDFADRRIDPTTGSVQMRAVFPNPDGALLPGQFVRIRLTLQSYDNAILIEPTAVSQGPQGPQVFIVSDDNTARAQPVTLGPTIDDRQLIRDGLKPGDRLVVNGHVALQDGAAVQVTNGNGGEQ